MCTVNHFVEAWVGHAVRKLCWLWLPLPTVTHAACCYSCAGGERRRAGSRVTQPKQEGARVGGCGVNESAVYRSCQRLVPRGICIRSGQLMFSFGNRLRGVTRDRALFPRVFCCCRYGQQSHRHSSRFSAAKSRDY